MLLLTPWRKTVMGRRVGMWRGIILKINWAHSLTLSRENNRNNKKSTKCCLCPGTIPTSTGSESLWHNPACIKTSFGSCKICQSHPEVQNSSWIPWFSLELCRFVSPLMIWPYLCRAWHRKELGQLRGSKYYLKKAGNQVRHQNKMLR